MKVFFVAAILCATSFARADPVATTANRPGTTTANRPGTTTANKAPTESKVPTEAKKNSTEEEDFYYDGEEEDYKSYYDFYYDGEGEEEDHKSYYNDGMSCDWKTEETCYYEDSHETYCALIADGGCPCPEGEEKCGADVELGFSGICTSELCCDYHTEEECYDGDGWLPTSCAEIADGGCPCPEGEEKCGADVESGYSGYCTSEVCCDYEEEETCYDEYYIATSCAKISEGGCPCPEGEEKCGADAESGYSGYCTQVCCDYETEQTCYDEDYIATSCAKYSDGGCPEAKQNNFAWKQNKMFSVVIEYGSPKELVILRELKAKHRRATGEAAKHSLERKINALVRSVESRR